MFKDKYKDCFNDIKGDRQLLKTILEKADTTQEKHIPFRHVYSYAASCAAILVITCAVFLFNSDILKLDINKTNISTETAETQKTVIAPKSSPATENTTSSDNTVSNDVVNSDKKTIQENKNAAPKQQNQENTDAGNKIQSDESTSDIQEYAKETGTEAVTEAPNENNAATEEKAVDSESVKSEDTSMSVYSGARITSGGGSGGAAVMRAKVMHNTMPYISETENLPCIEAGSQIKTDFTGTNTLTVFEEGIGTAPTVTGYENGIICEEYNGGDNKTITIYSSENPLSITDGENKLEPSMEIRKKEDTYSAYIKGKYYCFIYAENVSENYVIKIAEALIYD